MGVKRWEMSARKQFMSSGTSILPLVILKMKFCASIKYKVLKITITEITIVSFSPDLQWVSQPVLTKLGKAECGVHTVILALDRLR